MGTATRKAMKREEFRQALAATGYGKDADAAAARKLSKTLSNRWIKRSEQPGNFHAPNGQRMAMRDDSGRINRTLKHAGK